MVTKDKLKKLIKHTLEKLGVRREKLLFGSS